MNSKKIARMVGILFIIGTLAGVLSVILTSKILGSQIYIQSISENQNRVILGALFIIIMGSLGFIPILLFPIFVQEMFMAVWLIVKGFNVNSPYCKLTNNKD